MPYYTYILYSKSLDRFYKGSTHDIFDRIQRHNRGREKATKYGVPWVLLWKTEKPDRLEAQKLEYKLKNLSRERLCKFMMKYREGVAGPDELLLIEQLSGC